MYLTGGVSPGTIMSTGAVAGHAAESPLNGIGAKPALKGRIHQTDSAATGTAQSLAGMLAHELSRLLQGFYLRHYVC